MDEKGQAICNGRPVKKSFHQHIIDVCRNSSLCESRDNELYQGCLDAIHNETIYQASNPIMTVMKLSHSGNYLQGACFIALDQAIRATKPQPNVATWKVTKEYTVKAVNRDDAISKAATICGAEMTVKAEVVK